MDRCLKILGDGQIWDLKGISPSAPQKTFEDLFSGRALAQMAQESNRQSPRDKRIFSPFKEKGRITGLSVTQALLSNKPAARKTARILLEDLAQNAARGIEVLTKGKGFKEDWSDTKRNYWRRLDIVIIGGGVSEGKTGRILVNLIRKYLSKRGLSEIQIYQARFPGKEAGIIGAVVNILGAVNQEAAEKRLRKMAAIGVDLGREDIGVGLLGIDSNSGKVISGRNRDFCLFRHSVRTPHLRSRKNFLDSRKDYTLKERKAGERIRKSILRQMSNLILQAKTKAQDFGLVSSRNIGVAIPGCTSYGYIINSTDYFPFFRKQDGFNFARALRGILVRMGLSGYCIHIINDGIAAGIANAYFGFSKVKRGKFAFLGVGSGLGGCVGIKG